MENKKIRILAIDDNRDNLVTLKALIKDVFSEAEISTALRGQQGLDLASAEDPDVILLDIIMPGMDGFEVCTRLKADEKLRDIPVVFVTALKGDKENRVKALECGAEAFLSKPIDTIELTAQIRAMLKIRAANIQKRDEKRILAMLVEDKTRELKESHQKTLQLLDDLKREQTLIEAIFDSIPGYLYVYDESGRLIKWNKKHETMTGYSAEELAHMTLDKWFDDEDIVRVKAAVRDVFEKGYGEVEAELILKNGDRMMTRSSGAPLILDGHKYFAGIGVDISERYRMEHALKQSEEKFQLLFNKAPLGYQSLDFEGRFIDVNQKWLETLGYDREEVIGKWFGDFLCSEYVEGFRQRFPIFKAQGYIYSEFEMMSKDGRQLFIGFDGKVGYDVAGNFKQTHCILQDITNQRKAEKALIESEEKYRRITESVSDVVWTADLNLNTTYVSPSVVKLLGESAEAHIARSLDEKFVPYSLKEVQLILSQELEKEKDPTIDKNRTRIVEAEHYRADGSVIWISMHISFLRNENGEIIGFQGVSRDITQRKKVERELLYLSNHDHLTGLYNRRFFEEKLAKVDTEQNLPLSIIMCDVNGLKLVNDSFGHDSGDELLKNAAITIKNACRDEDVLARIGGDEFVIILPKTTAIETVHIANHIKELASKQKVSSIELSISYGYDTKTNMKQPIIEIIANAENHMYRHKLYERSSIRSKTIDLIMNALFEKSNREAMHSNRVSSICLSIATYMNFDKDAVHQMRIAGLIHDIGKIGVDEKILNKPGSLTIDERRNIERHPEIGWRLLSSTNDFSELAQFVLNHHEKWDGGGYPNGIKGESIPIEARIIAVADAYDAMTSKRSYKSGLDKKSAIDELMRCAGTQFDPKIVDVFVKHVLSDNSDFRGIGSFEV